MSLGIATNSAMGGLRLTALGTRLVAENLANADTEGYATRRLVPGSTLLSGHNAQSQRMIDPVLLGATRSAEGTLVKTQVSNTGLATLERTFGLPGDAGSLNSLVTSLAASLQQATSLPESTAALQAVAQNADRLVTKFHTAEQQIQGVRQRADEAIAADIGVLNAALERVVSLNKDIQRQTLRGGQHAWFERRTSAHCFRHCHDHPDHRDPAQRRAHDAIGRERSGTGRLGTREIRFYAYNRDNRNRHTRKRCVGSNHA